MATCLENLPNELLLQIFDSLELAQLCRAFSSLNLRFECLLADENLRLYARPSTLHSLSLLEQHYSQIIGLSLINWKPNDVFALLHPSQLPRLVSLSIESSSSGFFGRLSHDLVRRVLSLPGLCVCQLKLASTLIIYDNHLPISNSIQYLTLGMITLNMLVDLSLHIPKLCSLTMWLDFNGQRFDYERLKEIYYCPNLKRFSIGVHNEIKFEQVLFLLSRMPRLHSFELRGSVWDTDYLCPRKWIEILLHQNNYPLLKRIKIQLDIRYRTAMNDVDLILANFNRPIFLRNNLHLVYDGSYFLQLTCKQKR